jgi:hypothetical protein
MLLKLFCKHFDQNKTILGLQVTATHNFITRLQETKFYEWLIQFGDMSHNHVGGRLQGE